MKYLLSAALAATLIGGAAHAAGDAAAGADIFDKRCKTCHMIEGGGETIVKGGKTGPNLHGVVGRTAGVSEDFKRYGKSLQALGESGFAWTEDEIVAYLEDPAKYLGDKLGGRQRSNMAYKLPSADDRANVAAYLATFSQ
jgi:cytochrome c